MLRKIAIRILLLLVIVSVLNIIYNAILYKADLQQHYQQALEIKDAQETTDIFYFAESSNIDVSKDDSLQKNISEITNLFFPTLKITAINKSATHAGIYKGWLEQLDLGLKTPKAIVVTLNLRSFDAAWIHSKLETQLRQSMVMAQPYPNIINRFLLALQSFDNKTDKQREEDMLSDWKKTRLQFPFPFKYNTVAEWDAGIAAGGFTKPNGEWDIEKIQLACHYVKSYAFNISDDNPRTKDFDHIAHWCSKHHIPLYLHLLAENVQYADSLVGKELVFLMRQNRDYLVKRYSNGNCKVIDNLESVNGRDFKDQDWTTEHYRYKGRMIIARKLAEGLEKQFNNTYKKAY